MTINLIDSSSTTKTITSTATENLISNYFRVESFGFLKLTSSEKYQQTWYPTPSDIVPAGWFGFDIHNASFGDFNGDGLMDIIVQPAIFPHVVSHTTQNPPIFLIQNGNGGFKDPSFIINASTFPVKHFLYRLGVSDFNQDGISDVALAAMPDIKRNLEGNQSVNQSPEVVFGSSGSKFNWIDSYSNFSVQNLSNNVKGYTTGHSMTTGDFNGDRYPDWFSNWYAFTNNKKEGFDTKVIVPNGSASINSTSGQTSATPYADQWWWPAVNAVASADFNEDGYDDLIYSTMPNSSTTLNGGDLFLVKGSMNGLLGGSDVIQIPRTNTISGNVGTNYMVAADLNGDGHKDLVFIEHYWTTDDGNSQNYYTKAQLRTFLGDGKGGLVEKNGMITDPYSGHRHGEGNIHVTDVNGDGWLDIILVGYQVNLTDVWNSGGKEKDYTTIFLNKNGSLTYVDPSNLAFVQPYQFTGEELKKSFYQKGVSKLIPVDIGNDGMMDFVGFVETPLNQWPQVEQQYTYAYLSRAIKPLGRDAPNEVLLGTKNSDKIFGYDGNDFMTGSGGSDTLDGGTGIDIAVYSGAAAGYTITITSSSSTAMDKTANRDGTDTLTNVERLQFTDTMLALDTGKDQTAGSGYMLYKAAFNRTPDAGGLGYWINQMDKGMSYSDVAKNFVNSTEFKTAFGGANPTVNTLVTKLYNNVLNRAPDAGGLAFWQEKLSTGWSTADVLGYFSTSGENVTNVTPMIANGIAYQQFVG